MQSANGSPRALKSVGILLGATFLGATLLVGAAPSRAAGQTGTLSTDECRCVDADGDEIDNCRCLRLFDPETMVVSLLSDIPRPRIGISLTTSPGDADDRGARVESVLEDGPADRVGIQEGDLITHINGRSLLDPLEDREAEEELDLDGSLPAQRLLHLARALEPGEEVAVRFLRDGEEQTATLVAEDLDRWDRGSFSYRFDPGDQLEAEELRRHMLELREDLRGRTPLELRFRGSDDEGWKEGDVTVWSHELDPDVRVRVPRAPMLEIARAGWAEGAGYFNECPESDAESSVVVFGTECIGGLRMEALNPRLGEYFGTEEGVLVADVHPDSKIGLEPGDVVLSVGDRKAQDPARLRRILRSYEPEEEVTLHIMRMKREVSVTGVLSR